MRKSVSAALIASLAVSINYSLLQSPALAQTQKNGIRFVIPQNGRMDEPNRLIAARVADFYQPTTKIGNKGPLYWFLVLNRVKDPSSFEGYTSDLGSNRLICVDRGKPAEKFFKCISDNKAFGWATNSYMLVDIERKMAFVLYSDNKKDFCNGKIKAYAVAHDRGPVRRLPNGQTALGSHSNLIFPKLSTWSTQTKEQLQILADEFGYIFSCGDGSKGSMTYEATDSPLSNLQGNSPNPWDGMRQEHLKVLGYDLKPVPKPN